MSSPFISTGSPSKSLLPSLKTVELQPRIRSESPGIAPPLLRIQQLDIARLPSIGGANDRDPMYAISIYYQQSQVDSATTNTTLETAPNSASVPHLKTSKDDCPADHRIIRKASEFGVLRDKIHLCARPSMRDAATATPSVFCEQLTEFLTYGTARPSAFARSSKSLPASDASALFSSFLSCMVDECQKLFLSGQQPASNRAERHIPCLVYLFLYPKQQS